MSCRQMYTVPLINQSTIPQTKKYNFFLNSTFSQQLFLTVAHSELISILFIIFINTRSFQILVHHKCLLIFFNQIQTFRLQNCSKVRSQTPRCRQLNEFNHLNSSRCPLFQVFYQKYFNYYVTKQFIPTNRTLLPVTIMTTN